MWPDSEQTQELLKDAAAGSPEAVNQLMDRHRESLRRMISLRMDRALAQRVDASDIVQDVLIEANRRLQDYIQQGKMPFHLWLRQLAKDHIIDMHRRHHAQRRSVDREQSLQRGGTGDRSSLNFTWQVTDPELTPAAATIRRELEARFFAALDQMDDGDQEIILMRHQEHLSNSEVAAALDLSPAAAGMRYLRAMRRLRTLLKERDSTGP